MSGASENHYPAFPKMPTLDDHVHLLDIELNNLTADTLSNKHYHASRVVEQT